jgi:PAT family beta-lactamase induction signal transducer AmpG
MIRLGILRSLWIFGILQALSTAGFFLLATIGPSLTALSAVIAFENLSGGMGTSAYAAYMASITDKRFTATQYALLTSLMGIPRVLAVGPHRLSGHPDGLAGLFHLLHPDRLPGLLLLLRIGGQPRG